MSLYTLALFLHVSGVIGIFGSLFIWLFGLAALRRARLVGQVRAIAWVIVLASPLMVGSVLLLGLSDAATDGWTSPTILLRFAIGLSALSAWVWVELTDKQPLLERTTSDA